MNAIKAIDATIATVALCGLVSAGTVQAQMARPGAATAAVPGAINVGSEAARGRWVGLAGASLAATSGNTSSSALVLNLDLSRLTDENKTSLSGAVNEARNRNNGVANTTSGKWSVAGQYDHNLTPVWFALGKLGFERDRVIDLKLRTLSSVGLGYHLVRSDDHTVDVFGGLSYSRETYGQDKTISDDTGRRFSSTAILMGQETSHRLTDTVFFKQRLEFYNGIGGQLDKLIRFNASLNVAMTKTLSLSVSLIDTYNSRPAEGQKKNDASLLTGVNVKLGGN
ncbi:MAG: DUF481 domain-containing protein [Rubrivivax sp.]|nr:MAG: DUF481 domain-containing protein [Rubrivivax sp.]